DEEHIQWAAVKNKNSGECYTGLDHGKAYKSMFIADPVFEDGDVPVEQIEEGFLTSTGRFVSRKEGLAMEKSRRKFNHNRPWLSSHEVGKNLTPSLSKGE